MSFPLLWLATLFVLSLGLSHAEDPPPTDISADLAKLADSDKIPAIAAAAIFRGNVVAAGATGIRKVGGDEQVTLDDRFHIGSCTKSMTATLAAQLVNAGKLKWASTVAEVFPEMEIHPQHQATTLSQLLTHTSGCPRDVPAPLWAKLWEDDRPEPEQRLEVAETVLALAPESPPGTRATYSNVGYTIAGAMLEKVTGKSYAELLKAHLFEPLDMRSAGFGPAATKNDLAQPHGHQVREGKLYPVPIGRGSDNPAAITPAGRVHCSIIDLVRYTNVHLGNHPELIDTKALEKLHRPFKPESEYAYGWMVVKRPWAGGVALTHNGSNTMSYAVMWLAPEKDFAAVAACNVAGEDATKACDEAIGLLIERYLKQED